MISDDEKIVVKDAELAEINHLAEATITSELVASASFAENYRSLVALSQRLSDLKKTIDNRVKEVLKERYEESGEVSAELGDIKYSYVPPALRENFRLKDFKKDEPDLYKKYVEVNQVKDFVRVSIKPAKERSDPAIEVEYDEF